MCVYISFSVEHNYLLALWMILLIIPMTLARGVAPAFSAATSVMSKRAAAASLSVLALAAVAVPPSSSFLKAGFRDPNFSKSALLDWKAQRGRGEGERVGGREIGRRE